MNYSIVTYSYNAHCFHSERGKIHEEEDEGGVLVFLPGQDDIESLHLLLEEQLPSVIPRRKVSDPQLQSSIEPFARPIMTATTDSIRDYVIYPLYASMPAEEQLKAFLPPQTGIRKFVLSTNIAETSVTISGLKYGTT